MIKYQKFRASKKKDTSSILTLQKQLFSQLQSIQNDSSQPYQSDTLFNEFEENDEVQSSVRPSTQKLLNRAKDLTYTNKGKIEKMKREIKRLQQGEGPDFMTGVALFQKQTPHSHQPQYLDESSMLKDLPIRKFDDLQELRRMIKKTQKNLRVYSQSVYKTQNKVISAADHCGWDIDVGLAIKINKCNLDQIFSKAKTKVIAGPGSEPIRRRTTSSINQRKAKQ